MDVKVRAAAPKAAAPKAAPPKEASSTSSSSVPPPSSESALPATVLAAIPTGKYGCSKCRYRVAGCLACNPEKMYRHASK